MATLYVENVPDELYEALRAQARRHRNSIAKEVIGLLEEQVPTAKELARRQRFLKYALRMSKRKPLTPGPFPSTEEILREERQR